MEPLNPAGVLGPGGAIARRLPTYEVRSEQLRMAEAVASAIENGRHLVVEAGTGVGKSFAYLVPAILAAVREGLKVVVSTHTISLQEQLLEKDLPFLRSVMPEEFSAVLVKGRSNYVSLRRLEAVGGRSGSTFSKAEEFDQLGDIKFWANRTGDGSRSDLSFRPLPSVWDAVASENGNCLGRKCPRYNDCFYYRARRRMRTANLLVVNHALFMSDLAIRAGGANLLPDYDVAIFDEAHTLEATAAEHLGMRVTNGQLEYALNRLYNDRTEKGLLRYHALNQAMSQVQRVRAAARVFFAEVVRWRMQSSAGNGRLRRPLDWPDTLPEELRKLATSLADSAEQVAEEGQQIELQASSERCAALSDTIRLWQKQSVAESVYWVETAEGPRQKVSLACAPLDVGPTLRGELFEAIPTCVLASATLCVGTPPRFDFVAKRLGLDRCETLQLGSPFDYRTQVKVHLPRNMPDPSEQPEVFEREAIRAIRHYVAKTEGKAFVLFTSYRMLDAAVRQLSPWFERRRIALIAQSEGLPRSKMVEAFRADINSVIFGADSFWQGVDVPGEALSNVIIVKLPFSVPSHPLLEARLEEIRKRGGNPFVEYQVPEAVIKLKQGFGRLIRSRSDRGIVVLLDPRLLSKPYGRTFLNSLPDCPKIVEDVDLGPEPP